MDTKKQVTSKDLALTYMLGGIEDVQRAIVRSSKPIEVLSKTIEVLGSYGTDQNLDELHVLKDKFLECSVNNKRGRKAVAIGSQREYTAQRLGENEPFLHVPLTTFNVTKGQKILVEFKENTIILTKP